MTLQQQPCVGVFGGRGGLELYTYDTADQAGGCSGVGLSRFSAPHLPHGKLIDIGHINSSPVLVHNPQYTGK